MLHCNICQTNIVSVLLEIQRIWLSVTHSGVCNMKRTSQIEDSKQRITKSLLELLRQYDFKVITLNEIAAHAGVTRMTLHRHFKTKENIILYMAQKSLVKQMEGIKDSATPLLELMNTRLEALKNLPHRALLLESREIESLLNLFRINAFRDSLKERIDKKLAEDPYFYIFYFGGLEAIVRAWLEEDCNTPTQVLVQKIVEYTSGFMPR